VTALTPLAGRVLAFFVAMRLLLGLCEGVHYPLMATVTRLKRKPVPYLLAVAMASNAGSVATITGNPQNMIIGSVSGIPYGAFVAALAPVAAVALVLTVVLIAALHPKEFFAGSSFTPPAAEPVRYHRWLVWKTSAVALAMVGLFFAGQPVALVAIVAGAVLLLTRRVKPQKVYFEIDWPLLVMFAGLFVVVAGLEKNVIGPEVIAAVGRLDLASVPVLSAVTAVLSNLVSNVPAVLVIKPFLESFADPQKAWLVVAMASTLAGNFAIIGSVANLIVAERARRGGVSIGFWAYFRVGAPHTVLSIAFGTWWLA